MKQWFKFGLRFLHNKTWRTLEFYMDDENNVKMMNMTVGEPLPTEFIDGAKSIKSSAYAVDVLKVNAKIVKHMEANAKLFILNK